MSKNKEIPKDCRHSVDDVELETFIVEREPDSIGVYSMSEYTCDIYKRIKQSGFRVSRYKIDSTIPKHKVYKYDEKDVNLEELLILYSKTPSPLPDIFTQYQVYRERDCFRDNTYPGTLIRSFNTEIVSSLTTTSQKVIYLSAMLTLSPESLFEGTISQKKIDMLLREVTSVIHVYLSSDIDYREL